jgi:hypothetical protein
VVQLLKGVFPCHLARELSNFTPTNRCKVTIGGLQSILSSFSILDTVLQYLFGYS